MKKPVEIAAPVLTDSVVTSLSQVYHIAALAKKLINTPSRDAAFALLNKYATATMQKYYKDLSKYGFLHQTYFISDFNKLQPVAFKALIRLTNNITDLKNLVKNLKQDRAIGIDEVTILNSAILYFASLEDDRGKRSFTNVSKTSRTFAVEVNNLLGINSKVKESEEDKVEAIKQTLLNYVKRVKPNAKTTYKLTVEEQKSLSEIAKIGYKKAMQQLRELYLAQLGAYVVANGDKPVEVNKAVKYLISLGHDLNWIPEVPSGVKLNVSLKAGKITYYTDTFNELTGGLAPGSTNIKMASSYDKETKEGAYIQFKAPNAATITRLYTIEHKGLAQTSKFAKAGFVMEGFSKYIARWVKDMSNTDDNPTTRMMGSICYMVYLTGMRIGTRIKTAASTKNIMSYGAMSLRFEHVKLNAQTITVQYPGKKNVLQKHVIKVNTPQAKLLYKNLETFMKGKKKGDIIFSYVSRLGTEKTMNTGILTPYLTSVGFPVGTGIHKVRHARGTQFVIDALATNQWKPSLSANTTLKKQKEAEDWFKKKILEPVAGFLGHKSGADKLLWRTSVQNYCDPLPIKEWFEKQQLRIPKWVPLKPPKEEASVK